MKWIVMVRGEREVWGIPISKDTAAGMKEDGFEVYEVVNIIPAWVVDLGLTRLWVVIQDIWNWPSRWGR